MNFCTKCGNPLETGLKFCMRCGAPVEGARGLVEGRAIPAPVDSGTGQDRVAGPAKSIPADGPMPAYTAPPGVPPATKWATPAGVAPQQQAVATKSSRLPALLIALAVLALIALTVVGGTVYLGYKVKLKAAAMLHQAEAAGVLGTARTDTQPVAGSDAEKPKLASKPASDSDAPGSVAMQLPLDNDAATKATQPSTESSQDLPSLASAPSAASAPSGCPAPPGAFGSDKKMDVSMEGKIYFLPNDTGQLPDFSKLKSEGSIYASKWDVPERQFTLGFPGVTNRFEWFALDYQGDIYVPHSGSYKFRLGSDDGSILYLDDKKVLDNDGVHPWRDTDPTPVQLSQGDHRFRLSYFQGPAAWLGLQLFVTPPSQAEKIFLLQDFDKGMLENRSLLGVVEDAKEIRVKFGSEILFDTGNYLLKPDATKALQQLAGVVRGYVGFPIDIDGHTDGVGKPPDNQVLSEHRADAVKDWLIANAGVPTGCITTKGFGQTRPVASNDTTQGRQQNRRVEIHLIKPDPSSR